MLDIVHRQIEIECLPADIPNHIEVDVTRDDGGPEHPRARHRDQRRSGRPSSDPDTMMLHVIIPKVEEAPAPPDAAAAGAAAAPAEPEVIKKGKKEEARRPRLPLRLRARKTRSRSGDWGSGIGD